MQRYPHRTVTQLFVLASLIASLDSLTLLRGHPARIGHSLSLLRSLLCVVVVGLGVGFCRHGLIPFMFRPALAGQSEPLGSLLNMIGFFDSVVSAGLPNSWKCCQSMETDWQHGGGTAWQNKVAEDPRRGNQ